MSDSVFDMAPTANAVLPTSAEVVELMRRLIASDWPTTEEERVRWFAQHRIVTDDAVLERDEDGSESYACRGAAEWGRAHSGWHVFEEQFVGVRWFLWQGLGADVVPRLAQELHAGLVDLAGEPTEEIRPGGDRFAAYWDTAGRRVEMYLHGGSVLGGELAEEPLVQLHVDHVERAHRADLEAD